MKLTADEQTLKETILDVLDNGPTSRPYWEFYEYEAQSEDGANRDRLDFANEVINRIRRAKAPETETMVVPGLGRVTVMVRDDGQVEPISVDRQPRRRDDIDERDIPHKLDPRPTSEIVANLVREVAAETYGLEGYARNMHLGAARVWEHVADIEQHRVACVCFNPVQTAEAATGRASEATKAAVPNAAAFAATIAAVTACALRDAPAAAKAHRRAAAAYSAKEEA